LRKLGKKSLKRLRNKVKQLVEYRVQKGKKVSAESEAILAFLEKEVQLGRRDSRGRRENAARKAKREILANLVQEVNGESKESKESAESKDQKATKVKKVKKATKERKEKSVFKDRKESKESVESKEQEASAESKVKKEKGVRRDSKVQRARKARGAR
jgi:hypothetical protein